MPTDDERREVARRLREYVDLPDDWWQETCAEFYVEKCVFGNVDRHSEAELFTRLADLIEPTDGFDLDTVQRVCFECMEGCDEPEWTLYTTIHDAIARYKRGESGPACDRDALLALADSMCVRRSWLSATDAERGKAIARRIREALGCEKTERELQG